MLVVVEVAMKSAGLWFLGALFIAEEWSPTAGMPCPAGRPCLWKCCLPGYKIQGHKCQPGGSGKVELLAPPNVTVTYGKPLCGDMYYIFDNETHTIVYESGSVIIDEEVNEYCVDENELNKVYTYVCFPEDELSDEKAVLEIYSFGLFLSTPLLLATFLVYVFFAKARQNLHGKCVVFYTGSLLLSYVCLGLVWASFFLNDVLLCASAGKEYLIHFERMTPHVSLSR